MFYKKFSDYMLDNRYHFANKLWKCKSKQTLVREALDAYDFAVTKAIEHHESYKLLKAAMVEELGKEKSEEIETKAAKNFMQLQYGIDNYFGDVKSGKKVGYSAEE